MPNKEICKYCGEKIEKEWMKKHEEVCDKNPKSLNYKDLRGLGGWLILVQISFWLSLIIYAFLFIDEIIAPTLGIILPIIIFLFGVYIGYTLFLMYSKRKLFVNFAIGSLWIPFIFPLISLFTILGEALPSFYELGGFIGGMIIYVIPAIIWTLYFKKSERVKNTFIK